MSVATRNIVDEGINSPSSEETERHEMNEIVESSVSSPFAILMQDNSYMNISFCCGLQFYSLALLIWRNLKKLIKQKVGKELLLEEGVGVPHHLQREGGNQTLVPSTTCSWTRMMTTMMRMTSQTDLRGFNHGYIFQHLVLNLVNFSCKPMCFFRSLLISQSN